jgi:hypothetical protein
VKPVAGAVESQCEGTVENVCNFDWAIGCVDLACGRKTVEVVCESRNGFGQVIRRTITCVDP